MKFKHPLLRTALSIAIGTTAYSSHAFDLGNNILSYDSGAYACLYGGTYPSCSSYATDVTGSYFAMDTNGDGIFRASERIPITIGPAGGITLGELQPALGSHGSCPNGTETPGPDMPWCFFGNTGMHQVTGTPVINNNDGTLDFSGWGVTWNNIPNIPLGGDTANFPEDSGLANISCTNTPCQQGDISNLDYYAHIPLGSPSGFGGVYYTLHLANVNMGPVANIAITIANGTTQECNSTGGNTISVTSNYTIPADDTLDTINWRVDGAIVGSGNSLQQFLSLGKHRVEAEITTFNGVIGRSATNVVIQDTTPPETTAAFVDRRRNTPMTSVRRMSRVKISAVAADICDAAPVVTSVIGAPVQNNDLIRANKNRGTVSLSAPNLSLFVTGTDSSGNSSSAKATLSITR